MTDRVTLSEMATACQDEADSRRASLSVRSKQWPDLPPFASVEKQAAALEAAASVLRIMATGSNEEKSRKFVAELQAGNRRQ